MREKAKQVAGLMKLLSNENRLLILCALMEKPMTVTEIKNFTPEITVSALSQHLNALRLAGIVSDKKSGQFVTYSICDKRIELLFSVIKDQYC